MLDLSQKEFIQFFGPTELITGFIYLLHFDGEGKLWGAWECIKDDFFKNLQLPVEDEKNRNENLTLFYQLLYQLPSDQKEDLVQYLKTDLPLSDIKNGIDKKEVDFISWFVNPGITYSEKNIIFTLLGKTEKSQLNSNSFDGLLQTDTLLPRLKH